MPGGFLEICSQQCQDLKLPRQFSTAPGAICFLRFSANWLWTRDGEDKTLEGFVDPMAREAPHVRGGSWKLRRKAGNQTW